MQGNEKQPERLVVGISEAATMLDVNSETIRRMLKVGELTPRRIRSQIKISLQEIYRLAGVEQTQ